MRFTLALALLASAALVPGATANPHEVEFELTPWASTTPTATNHVSDPSAAAAATTFDSDYNFLPHSPSRTPRIDPSNPIFTPRARARANARSLPHSAAAAHLGDDFARVSRELHGRAPPPGPGIAAHTHTHPHTGTGMGAGTGTGTTLPGTPPAGWTSVSVPAVTGGTHHHEGHETERGREGEGTVGERHEEEREGEEVEWVDEVGNTPIPMMRHDVLIRTRPTTLSSAPTEEEEEYEVTVGSTGAHHKKSKCKGKGKGKGKKSKGKCSKCPHARARARARAHAESKLNGRVHTNTSPKPSCGRSCPRLCAHAAAAFAAEDAAELKAAVLAYEKGAECGRKCRHECACAGVCAKACASAGAGAGAGKGMSKGKVWGDSNKGGWGKEDGGHMSGHRGLAGDDFYIKAAHNADEDKRASYYEEGEEEMMVRNTYGDDARVREAREGGFIVYSPLAGPGERRVELFNSPDAYEGEGEGMGEGGGVDYEGEAEEYEYEAAEHNSHYDDNDDEDAMPAGSEHDEEEAYDSEGNVLNRDGSRGAKPLFFPGFGFGGPRWGFGGGQGPWQGQAQGQGQGLGGGWQGDQWGGGGQGPWGQAQGQGQGPWGQNAGWGQSNGWGQGQWGDDKAVIQQGVFDPKFAGAGFGGGGPFAPRRAGFGGVIGGAIAGPFGGIGGVIGGGGGGFF